MVNKLGLILLAATPGVAYAQRAPQPPKTEFLMHLRADLQEPQNIGDTPLGRRHIFYVTGGTFAGPGLQGEVLPGGGDWVLVRKDGVSQLDVRITLRSDDGCMIFVNYRGLVDIPPDIRSRIAKGEDVPSDRYYFRITPAFETGCQKLAWLNKLVAIGVGKKSNTAVSYDIFAVR
jgi:hypothetical protein